MQLYLDSFGAYLYTRSGQFVVRMPNSAPRRFAVRHLDAILLTRGTGLSADAGILAAEHEIPVLLIDAATHYPLAQLWPGQPVSVSEIRRNQALFSRHPAGFRWVAGWIGRKIEQQRDLLIRLSEQEDVSPAWTAALPPAQRLLSALSQQLNTWEFTGTEPWDEVARDKAAGWLRGIEGTASRVYFQQLSALAPSSLTFSGRQSRPAYDPFNAGLNYLYGILYTQVQLALLKTGLDPYLAVLHADQYGGRPTFVFDFIEPYRPWADEIAIRLLRQNLWPATAFQPAPDGHGLWIGPEAKSVTIDAMLQHLNQPVTFHSRQVKRSVRIDLEAQQLAVRLKTERF